MTATVEVKIGRTSKQPHARTWNLPAGKSCGGMYDVDTGEVCDACASCYAKRGHYNWPAVVSAYEYNMEDWKREGWVDDMVMGIKGAGYFRWFSSGDCKYTQLADKMYQVMERTPDTMHNLPTKGYINKDIDRWLDKMQTLPNVVVRRSSQKINGIYDHGIHRAIQVPHAKHPVDDQTMVCPSFTTNHKCGDCRACWDDTVQVVAFITY